MLSSGDFHNSGREVNKRVNHLLNEFIEIESESAQKAGSLTFMPRTMVMATLPHSNPDGHIFQRKNGYYTLTMKADPQYGLPYGSIPRLIFAWITREAIRTSSPTLHLGKTFSVFLRELNLNQNGGMRGDATRLRNQMLRLFTTNISYIYQNDKEGVCQGENFLVARSFNLWWDPLKAQQGDVFAHSTITLSKDFFEEIKERPIPVDYRMLRALSRSPLQIDIYIWLTYRFFNLKKSTLIPWFLLKEQFGSNYANTAMGLRDFRKNFLKALKIVLVMYQDANVEPQESSLVLNPSKSHIRIKHKMGEH